MVTRASSCVTSRIAAADLEAARDVLQAAFAEQGHDTARDLDQLREEFARPWSRLWVARREADAPIVAVLLAWHIVDELEILDVATHPDHRRLGYARALVAGAVAFAAEHAVVRVLLEARRQGLPLIIDGSGLNFVAKVFFSLFVLRCCFFGVCCIWSRQLTHTQQQQQNDKHRSRRSSPAAATPS